MQGNSTNSRQKAPGLLEENILFEDNHIIIINKLPSQIVQGDMAQAMAKPSTVQAEATAEHGVSHGPVDRMLVRRGL